MITLKSTVSKRFKTGRVFGMGRLVALIAIFTIQQLVSGQDLRSLVYRAPPGGYQGLSGEVKIYERSYAVVIGVSAYERLPELPGAVPDAENIAAALREHQFEVTLLRDREATRSRITEELGDRLLPRLQPNDRVFIYFAGHGVTVGRGEDAMGYLMPVEGDNERRMATGIAMSELQRLFAVYPAKHVMFVADACYSGLALSTRSTGLPTTLADYLRQVTRKRVRLALTAGRSDQEAHEWRGQGLFTYFLIEALEGHGDINGDGILTSSEIYAYVEPNVAQTALSNWRANQNPQMGRSGEGEFIFLVPGHSPVVKEESVAAPSEAVEITFWKSIENSPHREDYEAYLARFPSGIFAELARLKMNRLTDTAPSEVERAPAVQSALGSKPDALETAGDDRSGPTIEADASERLVGRAGSAGEAERWAEIRKASESADQVRLSEEFLETYPESGLTPHVHYVLASVYRRAGDTERFVAHAEKALGELSGLPDLSSHLAFVYAETGRSEEAVRHGRLALDWLEKVEKPSGMSDGDWDAQRQVLKSEALYALGRVRLSRAVETEGGESERFLREAIGFLSEAVENAPHNQFGSFRLAEAHIRNREPEKAMVYLARTAALGGEIGDVASRRLDEVSSHLGRQPDHATQLVEQEKLNIQAAIRERVQRLEETDREERQPRRPTLYPDRP
jgi:tetratricopeptide (TPR) repeat protein